MNPRIGSRITSSQQHSRAGFARAPACDGDLRAGEIKLGIVWEVGLVEGDILCTEKIVARWQRLGDLKGDLSQVLGGEGNPVSRHRGADLVDFEPRCAAVRCASFGDFGHVDGCG